MDHEIVPLWGPIELRRLICDAWPGRSRSALERPTPCKWTVCGFLVLALIPDYAMAAGTLCTRLNPGVCTAMEKITTPLWISSSGEYNLTVLTANPDPLPTPFVGSEGGVVQLIVSLNPLRNTCGSTPAPVSAGIYEIHAPEINDQHSFGIGTEIIRYSDPPELQLDSPTVSWIVEEFYRSYLWKPVPIFGDPPGNCNGQTGFDAARRRVGICPVGFQERLTYPLYPLGDLSTIIDTPDICYRQIEFDPKNLGDCNGANESCGNPIAPATGNKFQREADISATGAGTLELQRYYNSTALGSQTLGQQWRHSYDRDVSIPYGNQAWVQRPDGKGLLFTKPSSGSQWVGKVDAQDQLYSLLDGAQNPIGWRYVTASDTTEIYDGNGNLLSISTRAGVTQSLTYSTGASPAAPKGGLLLAVADSYGRHLDFVYDSQARLVQVTDSLGQVYQYGYDATGMLSRVTYPDSQHRDYVYNEPTYTSGTDQRRALTGIYDENGDRFATFSFDSTGRAIATEHAGHVDRNELTFQTTGLNAQTLVTDPLGTQRTYAYSGALTGQFRNTSLAEPYANSASGTWTETRSYDTHGNLQDVSSPLSHTTYIFDLARNLETLRTEAAGYPAQRQIATTWHPTYRLPATITEAAPGGTKTTTFLYDTSGNLLQKSIVAPKNDGTGNTITRAWNWTYGTLGRVLTATDPDAHTTTTTYYTDNDPDLGKRGNVATITNAAGHATQITAYDANGRPLSITDPNGLVTTLTYHPRGWLTSRQVGAELTSYSYDAVGQLSKVTMPDGSYLQYTYDAAHRLIQVNDSLNNRIAYTLDALGNRIKEEAFDPSNALSRTRQQVFDSLNRLHQMVGAQ